MEQNNIEQQFREKLGQRTLAPSENAWDRLDAMLSVAEGKKPKRNFKWLYIAAGLLGFLFLGTVFLTMNDNTTIEKTVVVKDSPIEKAAQPEEKSTVAPEAAIILQKNEKAVAAIVRKPLQKPEIQKENNAAKEEHAGLGDITDKPQDVKGKYISADELLAAVMTTGQPSVKSPKVTVKVDPAKMLSEVEGELDETFREKVIHSVGKNFNTVKTAVVNRNYN
ncbi:hypothetical protein [Flavobacterium kingsejongi]|nr:hypothetical protein [Flavobacterium kingsejongi]